MTPEQYKALMDKLTNIELMIGQSYRGSSADDGGAVAPDSDLDGDHGNPTVKYDLKPKYWSGASMVGKRWSECPPEWLDACAAYLSNYASALRDNPKEEDDAKKAKYKEKDASRARGWAKRLRSGWRLAGAARPQGAPPRVATAPTAAAYGQAPPRGFGADATGQGQQAAYGGGAGYGGGGSGAPFAEPGGDDQDIPFVSCAFDPHAWR